MVMSRKRFSAAGLVLAACLVPAACATLEQIAGSLLSLRRLEFRLGAVRDFALVGVRLEGKAALTDFSAFDAVALAQGFRSRKLPAEFVLDVLVRNPNTGTGGSTKTVSTLTSLESRLLIDGKTTVTGNIDRPMEIPGTGEAAAIPIRMTVDLYEFFGQKSYEDIIGLALAIGGRGGSPSRLTLDAQPRVTTPLGEIAYPGRLTIIDKEFR